jgi:hypothetical protein
VASVRQRIVRGSPEGGAAALTATGGTRLNTAYIERLNTTFRSSYDSQHQLASIDVEGHSRHVASGIGSQEQNGIR